MRLTLGEEYMTGSLILKSIWVEELLLEKKKAIIIKTLLFPKPSQPDTTSNYLLLVSQISFMCLISLINQIYLPIDMRETTQEMKRGSSHQTKENRELLQSSVKDGV